MKQPVFSDATYWLLFFLLGLAYVAGLFVPLMDNDSAHHANIALHMYLHRDYVNLIDAGQDYLDKPHLLFWLCATSYKIFGVTSFAYKFPSFCFTVLGTWSVYRLGKSLYSREVGRLAALIAASAFAYMLANNDVRMDAALTACVAFATWQGVDFIRTKRILNAIGLALGLAAGFCTKGHIAVFTPAVGLFSYIIFRRDWKLLVNWKWLVVLFTFAAFISPVVYCYYLQYNLHPEKIVRGKDHINGVRFILLGQSVERFQGDSFGGAARNDYLFFFHSFLWAFAPWSVLAYVAVLSRIRAIRQKKTEWLSLATFLTIAIILTFSGFKLPHYLNIIFPATAVLTAGWLLEPARSEKNIFRIQAFVCGLLLVLAAMVNVWLFPVHSLFVIIVSVPLLSVVFYFLLARDLSRRQKALGFSVATMVVSLFLSNANFYPQLLKYQGGNEMAKKIRGNVDPANVYFWGNNYSSSFNFYTVTERRQFADSIFEKGKKPIWLLFDRRDEAAIEQAGYRVGISYTVPDFEVTRLTWKFANPATRQDQLTTMVVGELTGRK